MSVKTIPGHFGLTQLQAECLLSNIPKWAHSRFYLTRTGEVKISKFSISLIILQTTLICFSINLYLIYKDVCPATSQLQWKIMQISESKGYSQFYRVFYKSE